MKKLVILFLVLGIVTFAIPCMANANNFNQNISKVHLRSVQTLTNIDKIDFTFTVSTDFEGIITNNVANVGSNVVGCLEHFSSGSSDYYILSLNGNKGKISLWTVNYRSLDSKDVLSSSSPIEFSSCNRLVDDSLVIYDANEVLPDSFFLQGRFENNSLEEVKFNYKPFSYDVVVSNNMTNSVLCKDIRYESFNSENTTLSDKFQDKDKETEIENAIKENEKYDVQEQDPERYTTQVKGVRNDGRVIDYSISFIAEIPLNTDNNNNLPAWYSRLGNNVTATLIGFTQTIDGEENRNYTMIRFSGTKGNAWFNNADTIPMKTEDDTIIVDNSYVSLVSFDGKERVYNSVTHETLDTKITFSNDDNMYLLNIAIKIGNKTISVDSSNVKYIGGGKATYEKLW